MAKSSRLKKRGNMAGLTNDEKLRREGIAANAKAKIHEILLEAEAAHGPSFRAKRVDQKILHEVEAEFPKRAGRRPKRAQT